MGQCVLRRGLKHALFDFSGETMGNFVTHIMLGNKFFKRWLMIWDFAGPDILFIIGIPQEWCKTVEGDDTWLTIQFPSWTIYVIVYPFYNFVRSETTSPPRVKKQTRSLAL